MFAPTLPRYHNLLVRQYADQDPSLTDEQLYQRARRWLISVVQKITFFDFYPALTGRHLPKYRGYDPRVSAQVAVEFAAAAYRFHSLVGEDFDLLQADANFLPQAVLDLLPAPFTGQQVILFEDAFFTPAVATAVGIEPFMKYSASSLGQQYDTRVVNALRNFLFSKNQSLGGTDLLAINIQRGRDAGVQNYNSVRRGYGLKAAKTFKDVTTDAFTHNALHDVYANIGHVRTVYFCGRPPVNQPFPPTHPPTPHPPFIIFF